MVVYQNYYAKGVFQVNYTKVSEIRQHSYLIVPKELFLNERYSKLNNDARVTYAFLLDRLQLSVKNGWHDEQDRVFLIFTREKLAEIVGVSLRSMTTIMRQLVEVELVEEKRQGLNKPNLIYIGKITYEQKKPSRKPVRALKKDFDEREYNYDELERKLLGWE